MGREAEAADFIAALEASEPLGGAREGAGGDAPAGGGA